MAKTAANVLRVYLDEFAISGYTNNSQMTVDQETLVTTCFEDAGPRRLVGNYDVMHDDAGFFEGGAGLFDVQLDGLIDDNDHYLTKLPNGSAENSVAYDSVVRLTGKPMSAQAAGAILLKVASAGANGLVRGLVLGSATVSGAGDRTGRNQGATTLGQIYAVQFRVITFSGTNIVLKIQESSDDASADAYADISGLTSGTLTAAGVVRATTTAATEAWKRVNISTPGGFTSAVILVTAGVVAGSAA